MTEVLFVGCFAFTFAAIASLYVLLHRVWRESPQWAAKNDILRIADTVTFTPRYRVRAFYAHLRARSPEMMTHKYANAIRFLLLYGDWTAFALAGTALIYHWSTSPHAG